jgi:hypothetical protein
MTLRVKVGSAAAISVVEEVSMALTKDPTLGGLGRRN